MGAFFLIVFFSVSAQATTHYVSPNGSATWSNSTNISMPCSLSTALANADDDDVVYLRAGTYTTKLQPSNSGSSGHVITFQNYNDEVVVIDGENTRSCINLYGKSYITIDGIGTENSSGNYSVYLNDDAYAHTYGITIQNGTFDGGGVRAEKTSNLIVKYNTIQNTSYAGIVVNGSGCSQTRVEGNTISGDFTGTDAVTYHVDEWVDGGKSPSCPNGDYHIIKNNSVISTVAAENCYDITSGDYIVMDGNTCTGNVGEPGTLVGNSCSSCVPANTVSWIRIVNNSIYSLQGNAEHIHFGGYGADYIQILRNKSYGYGEHNIRFSNSLGLTGTRYIRIFHNTLDGRIIRDNINLQFQNTVADVDNKNNIFYLASGDSGINWADPGATDMLSDYNLYWNVNNSPGAAIWGYTPTHTLAQVRSSYNREINGIEADPLFVNVANQDYSLQSGSSAIDAGGWLTIITSSTGSGTIFTVDDPLWFYDGWNISGETGDIIKTASGKTATIISINYTTGKITVNSQISWTIGEGIGLDFKDSRPDIGAFEYSSNASLSPPAGLKIKSN